MEEITVTTRIETFHLKRKPIAPRRFWFRSVCGIPPSRVPAGQIYLQNHGCPSPVISITNTGRRITNTRRIKYLNHRRNFSPGRVLIFFTKGILKRRSCTSPKGHKNRRQNAPGKCQLQQEYLQHKEKHNNHGC